MGTLPELASALAEVIGEVVGPAAAQVDAEGRFPRRSIDALADLGLLRLPVAVSHGGLGLGLAEAVDVVRAVGAACGSTAMILLMHYSAAVALDRWGTDDVRRTLGGGRHLTTLALSEVGSRSEFWVPLSSATDDGGTVVLNARKSWVTSAGEADSYVWSSRPVAGDGEMTLWFVPAASAGLSEPGTFDGLGLRGNGSAPLSATDVRVPAAFRLGADGGGLGILRDVVLPWFLVLNAAFCAGLMDAVTEETGRHLVSARLEHRGQSLADVQLTRVDHARMRLAADEVDALLEQTVRMLATGAPEGRLRMLGGKAAAGEAAATVSDLATKVCGGAAFRHELSIERRFRDARAARVMAPTTDALLDFIGRAINGMPWP